VDRKTVLDKCEETLLWLSANGLAQKEKFEEKERELKEIQAKFFANTSGSQRLPKMPANSRPRAEDKDRPAKKFKSTNDA